MAQDLNSVILVGRLTKDAELKYLTSGTAVMKFSLAVNRSQKTDSGWTDKASFFDVEYFGKGAEAVNQYMTKGKQVGVKGTLEQQTWEKDGEKRSKVVIKADSVQLLGGEKQSKPAHQEQGGYEDDIPF
jgi:single-strand DNA-binding protein